MTQPVRQACDACRRRKIKCSGLQPCTNCKNADLACRYLQVPRKRGRQGETANVLSELRQSQPTQYIVNNEGSHGSPASPTSTIHGSQEFEAPRLSPPGGHRWPQMPKFPPPALVNVEMIGACIDFYLAHIRTTVPILDRQTLEQEVILMNDSLQSYCFIISFCAYVILQTGGAVNRAYAAFNGKPLSMGIAFGQELVDEALEARRFLDITVPPSCCSVLISFFLYGSYVGLGNQRQAWFHLREATTIYTSGPLAVDPGIKIHNPTVSNRMFWLLLISERSHAIRRRRPITLQVTPDAPPSEDQGSSSGTVCGFGYLTRLFRPFDEQFFALWNRSHTACTEDYLVRLEIQIEQAVPLILDLSEEDLANLRVSQQWLRIMLWELSTLLGFLSSTSVHECLSFRHPLGIARDLTFATWKLSHRSLEVHGVGMTEKIFDVACAVTDILSYIPSTRVPSSGIELGPEDYLKHFCGLMIKLPGGQTKFVPLLLAKMGQLLPSLLTPIAQHLQLPIPTAEEAALTPDSAHLYDEEIRAQLNTELSRIGMETLEKTSGDP